MKRVDGDYDAKREKRLKPQGKLIFLFNRQYNR